MWLIKKLVFVAVIYLLVWLIAAVGLWFIVLLVKWFGIAVLAAIIAFAFGVLCWAL